MTSTTYQVEGMSCGHCVDAVTAELTKLPDVQSVDVDLSTGEVTVTSATPLDPTSVADAVDEAGYELRA